ncbi:uncharacterized protein LOC126896663 [Daktulosphaira vitifoliae]|uniref:uncharacterized protein LOC126896663 n=1 Tax=Daktulosphaira vitifoliae TaxID=58002 RepID=UPI0021AA5768|nr:uncharacterized protein LOC126896663 [Daktulosphaira vitifoliae]
MSLKLYFFFTFLCSYFPLLEANFGVDELSNLIQNTGWKMISELLSKQNPKKIGFKRNIIFVDKTLKNWTPNKIIINENNFEKILKEVTQILSSYYALELYTIMKLLNNYWTNYRTHANPLAIQWTYDLAKELYEELDRMANVLLFLLKQNYSSSTIRATLNFRILCPKILALVDEPVISYLKVLESFFKDNFGESEYNEFYIISDIDEVLNIMLQDTYFGSENKITYIKDQVMLRYYHLIEVNKKLGFNFDEKNKIVGLYR